MPQQVLFKHGQGGCYHNGEELEELRRTVRQGDTIQIQIGRQEVLKTKNDNDDNKILWHATQTKILAVKIHGNTGSSYVKTIVSMTEEAEEIPNDQLFHKDELDNEQQPQEYCDKEEVHLPSKKERFSAFAEFIAAAFPSDNHIFDIAGGRGELALLLTLAGHKTILVDPRENAGMLSSRSRKQLRKSGNEPFQVIREFFDETSDVRILKTATETPLLIGLHPDEATEAIVDAAIRNQLAFAVIPCCVYSRLFPSRRYKGKPVRTHEQFCNYLQSKAPNIQRTMLNFGGHATVLYHLGDYGEG